MTQRELSESPKQVDLVIKKANKPQLSKHQKAFNRLVKKLERLKKEYEDLRATLDEGLNFFAGSIHPKEVQLTNALGECIKAFFSFYKARTGLSATQKRLLKEMIERTLENVLALSNDKPDEDMKAIFEEIYGMSMEQAASEEFEEMKWEMQEMFEDAGLDFDFDDFNFSSNEEEMMAKFKAMQEEAFRGQEEKQKKKDARKKTKKQIEREEKQKKIIVVRQKNKGGINTTPFS